MISAIILAAGRSERMRPCKQLVEIEGRTMIEQVVSSAKDSRVDDIIVVLGYGAERVEREIPNEGVEVVLNPDFEKGMSTSLKAGLENVSEDTDAVLIILADQPFVGSETIDMLIEEYERSGAPIVVPLYKGERGNPVLLNISLKEEMMCIRGDVGAREIVERHRDEVRGVEVDTPSVLMDVDTKEDIERLMKYKRKELLDDRELTVVIRGAGEIASGVAHYLFSKGLRVIMTEVLEPTTQRRTVAFGEAVFSDEVEIEGVKGKKVSDVDEIFENLENNIIPVIVDPEAEIVKKVDPEVLVDGIMAKENVGTKREDADLVIGLGPGFRAGEDVNVVIETAEGPDAGRAIYEGSSRPNTGIPCEIEGYTTERILRSPSDGVFRASKKILDPVEEGEKVGEVDGERVKAKISGTVRGLVKDGLGVVEGQKLGDIDPRELGRFGIAERSLSVGKGVWRAIVNPDFIRVGAESGREAG